jgi:hypothetical protein
MSKERPISERFRISFRERAAVAAIPLALLMPASSIAQENPTTEHKPPSVTIFSTEQKSFQNRINEIRDLIDFRNTTIQKSDLIIDGGDQGKGSVKGDKKNEILAGNKTGKTPVKSENEKNESKDVKTEVKKEVKKAVEAPHLGKVPLFNQADKRWGDIWYGTANLTDSGCGPTSLAMVISYYADKIIYPPEVAKKVLEQHLRIPHVGTDRKAMIEIPKLYGLDSHKISWDEAKKDLHEGKPIIQVHGPGYFTSGGHYIVVTRAEGDKYYVNDSGPRHRTVATEKEIKQSLQASWIITKKA